VSVPCELERLAALLSDAGFLAADEEAGELLECAGADPDRLESLVRRRLTGEPLAWITGSVSFCGLTIHVEPGVYVPRRHSEELARRAARRLPAHGAAVDPCTGTGALARTLMGSRPGARSRRPWRASRSRPGELLPPRAQALDAA
jgi:release factor glutamine methyltransferase